MFEIVFVLLLLLIVFYAFVREKYPPDIIAMAALAILLITGILSIEEATSVFSNQAPITIGAMFVLSAALERTGVIDRLGRIIISVAGKSQLTAMLTIMPVVMLLSAFTNNTPIVVVLTPVIIMLARQMDLKASRLLIPLSYAAIFGGMTTLIGTSTNLLVNGVALEKGYDSFGMFEMTAPALIMGTVGILYMLFVGRFLLRDRMTIAGILGDKIRRQFIAELLIPQDSPLIGKNVMDAGLTADKDTNILDVVRGTRSLRFLLEDVELKAGDHVVIETNASEMIAFKESGAVEFKVQDQHVIEPIRAEENVTMEGIVGPHSSLVGRQLSRLNLRRLYGIYILAVHRSGEQISSPYEAVTLEMGDTLLLEGPAEGLKQMFDEEELVNLSLTTERPLRRRRAPIAILAALMVIILAAFDVMPIASLALIAASGLVLTRCIDPDEVYTSIDWNILFLIFGMLGLAKAMDVTGAADFIVTFVMGFMDGYGPWALLAVTYLMTSLLTEMISNNAVAVLMAPIAIGIAAQAGLDPRPFLIAVMFAGSASFTTPIGYQTNTFVYSAGGYKFTDFVRVGLPLNLLMWAVAMIVIPIFWPFQAG